MREWCRTTRGRVEFWDLSERRAGLHLTVDPGNNTLEIQRVLNVRDEDELESSPVVLPLPPGGAAALCKGVKSG